MKQFMLRHEGVMYTFFHVRRRGQRRVIVKPLEANTYRISTPYSVSIKRAEALASEHIVSLKKLRALKMPKHYLSHQRALPIFGRVEPVTYISHEKKSVVKRDTLEVYGISEAHQLDALKRFLVRKLMDAVQDFHSQAKTKWPFLPLDGVTFSTRYVSSKFGSCMPLKKHIMFNLMLVHYPVRFLHFIYCHEVVHLVHKNHSKAFYDTLSLLCPNHREIKRELDAHHKGILTSST